MMAGDRAPDFLLRDHTGRPQTLSGLLSGGPVVLFFFPIASSPICTAEACHFRDLGNEFAKVDAQRVGISTNTADKQAHFSQQRSFDYPLLSDSEGVASELFGVRRGRLAKLSDSAVAHKWGRRGQHLRRRGLLARLMPVRRTTFVIDTDRTVLTVISGELRASMHADQALQFLQDRHQRPSSPPRREQRTDTHQQPASQTSPVDDWFTKPEILNEPNLVRPYTVTAGHTDAAIDLPLEARVEALNTPAKPPRWPKHDVRNQILTVCRRSPSVAEIAAAVSLPLGATRFLVGDLVTQGYLRVPTTGSDSMTVDKRRDLLIRTLDGLRAL